VAFLPEGGKNAVNGETMNSRPRRNHNTGLQDEGGACRRQGRPDDSSGLPSSSTFIPIRSRRGKGCASGVFGPGGTAPATPAIDVKSLHAKIGSCRHSAWQPNCHSACNIAPLSRGIGVIAESCSNRQCFQSDVRSFRELSVSRWVLPKTL
jgi:transposase